MSNREHKITVYRTDYGDVAGWRWHWQAGNNHIIAAATEAYGTRHACLDNLRLTTGGSLTWGYRARVKRGFFMQGQWTRGHLRVFVEVIP